MATQRPGPKPKLDAERAPVSSTHVVYRDQLDRLDQMSRTVRRSRSDLVRLALDFFLAADRDLLPMSGDDGRRAA